MKWQVASEIHAGLMVKKEKQDESSQSTQHSQSANKHIDMLMLSCRLSALDTLLVGLLICLIYETNNININNIDIFQDGPILC